MAIGEAEIRLVAVGVCRWVATEGSGATAGTESGDPFRSVDEATAPESENPRTMAIAISGDYFVWRLGARRTALPTPHKKKKGIQAQ